MLGRSPGMNEQYKSTAKQSGQPMQFAEQDNASHASLGCKGNAWKDWPWFAIAKFGRQSEAAVFTHG
eukprot:3925146-Pleurochrysis_carterae.AAC.3